MDVQDGTSHLEDSLTNNTCLQQLGPHILANLKGVFIIKKTIFDTNGYLNNIKNRDLFTPGLYVIATERIKKPTEDDERILYNRPDIILYTKEAWIVALNRTYNGRDFQNIVLNIVTCNIDNQTVKGTKSNIRYINLVEKYDFLFNYSQFTEKSRNTDFKYSAGLNHKLDEQDRHRIDEHGEFWISINK